MVILYSTPSLVRAQLEQWLIKWVVDGLWLSWANMPIRILFPGFIK